MWHSGSIVSRDGNYDDRYLPRHLINICEAIGMLAAISALSPFKRINRTKERASKYTLGSIWRNAIVYFC